MENFIRVLIVEDAPDDADLVIRELEKGGFDVESQRVDSAQSMIEALDSSPWDAVISDYRLPGFSGLQALQVLSQRGLDKPFVMISGKVGEEAAVEAMRAGAHDFLLKGHLSRLVPAIRREIAEASERREHRRTEKELREKLDFIQVLIDTLPTPIFYNDPNGLYLGCNKAFEAQVGMKREGIINKNIYNILPLDLAALYTKGEAALAEGKGTQTFEGTIACAAGESREVIFYCATFNNSDSSVGGVVGALLDISERKRTEMRLRYLSTHDMLTGIYNRAYFDEEMERLKMGRKFPVSIVMADVDRLKETNDQLGHAAGDELLRHAAELFKGAFRRGDVAARIGGDEFAALLPDTDETALMEAIERLNQHLSLGTKENGWSLLKLSIGAATANSGEELMAAWRTADERMYQEKKRRSARNQAYTARHSGAWDTAQSPIFPIP
ncbi:MAG TPA: diguanylate cyclase [Geomonas sp.]